LTEDTTVTGQPDCSLIVGYGTDMGNAEDAALTFTEALEPVGIAAEALELNQIDVADLQATSHFVVVTSTFGDGGFPDNATLFWEAISGNTERLEHLSFAVLALGDSGYDLFCNAGRLLDDRLEALGATRLLECVEIDGAYEQPAKAWTTDLVKLLTEHADTATAAAEPAPDAKQAARSRPKTFDARLAVNRLLTAAESDKEVRHYELDVAGFGYEAGDSIAVEAVLR
jgi:sulfite reductase (NADPH) flavoprotein alpha-component